MLHREFPKYLYLVVVMFHIHGYSNLFSIVQNYLHVCIYYAKTKLVLKDGSAIPDWVEFDPITGEINANPPEDVDKLEFKLIIERDGEIIVKDLAVDVGGDDNAQILDDKEDTKFIAFKDQLNKEHDNWEEYGSSIINRL